MSINPSMYVDQYPLPKPEEMFAEIAGGEKFTKLDLAQAYQQVLLEEESKSFVVVNIHQGLYKYTRLPFGVASASAVFQHIMERVLQGIPRVICYLDNILITGKDYQEHLTNLKAVLKRLQDFGLRLKRNKCQWMQTNVE